MNGYSHSPHAQTFLAPHHTNAGRNSNIFQPPQSPALSSSTDYFTPSHRSRKRSRPDSIDWTVSTPAATPGHSWLQCPTPGDGIYGSAGVENSGLVNERYLLRDGFDTPGLMAGTVEYERERERDLGERGRVRDDVGYGAGVGRMERRMLSGPLARERNGVARARSSPSVPMQSQTQQGWTGFAFGLVGKVFSLGSGVFRGFYAGGGRGYNVEGTPPLPPRPSRPWIARGSTPVPGAWQDDDFMGDFEQDNLSSPATFASRPSNKRRQTDRDSWVVVGTPDLTDSSSPKRKISSTSVPRNNNNNNNNLNPRSQASRASSRRSLAPVSQRRQSSHTTTSTGSPALTARSNVEPLSRRASLAPTRSRPSSSHKEHSPQAYVSPEAEKFVRRQAKQDRAADKAMSSMSRQLQDLIRQGQQALGTRYAIEDDGGGGMDLDGEVEMDGGFVDEEGGWR